MAAFNNLGAGAWVNVGSTIYWEYWFGDNRGAQYAMASCHTPDGQMVTLSQDVTVHEDGTATYGVTFQNNGPEPCFHNLNGGGLS